MSAVTSLMRAQAIVARLADLLAAESEYLDLVPVGGKATVR